MKVLEPLEDPQNQTNRNKVGKSWETKKTVVNRMPERSHEMKA